MELEEFLSGDPAIRPRDDSRCRKPETNKEEEEEEAFD